MTLFVVRIRFVSVQFGFLSCCSILTQDKICPFSYQTFQEMGPGSGFKLFRIANYGNYGHQGKMGLTHAS